MREPSLTKDKFLLQLIKHFGTPKKLKIFQIIVNPMNLF